MSFQWIPEETAREAWEWHTSQLDSDPALLCPHGLTIHGMGLMACADRALQAVGDGSPASEFWRALEEEEDGYNA